MGSFDDIQHKKRSVNDLIRYINNITNGEKTPNFSLLLGAGASITSGIRSGQSLIEEWRNEIYAEENVEESDNIDIFFSKAQWYDVSNPYSSLFEHRFDLQRQRRAFVEREVDNKVPSIGYAYLVSLIENNYFNTVFTTNFDDLLNEAFYRYSHKRPIVCAHDSSITGITVTSIRPKIIKLHGDYLFEDIKTTIRDTESLEDNMKQKFQEFAKDYGLIVVGYAGNDRSIMDVLTNLLRREEYFKTGIYWCVKKGETLSPELKRLIWMERVYYVEIDGFDELMASLNDKLCKSALPIKDDIISLDYQKRIVQQLTENKWIRKSESEILQRDCQILSKRLTENVLNDYYDFIIDRNNNLADGEKKRRAHNAKRKEKMKDMTKTQKDYITELRKKKLFSSECDLCSLLDFSEITNMEESAYKCALLELLADSSRSWTDDELKTIFEQLTRLKPFEQKYYIIAANRVQDYWLSKSFLCNAIEKMPNDYYLHNRKASLILDYCEDCIDGNIKEIELKDCLDEIEKSISINPRADNEAYLIKARYAIIMFCNNIPKKDQIKEEILKLYEKDYLSYPIYIDILSVIDKSKKTENLIRQYIDFYKLADNYDMVESLYIKLIDLYDKDKNKTIDSVLEIMAEYEKEYSPSDAYHKRKLALFVKYDRIDEAEKILDDNILPEELAIKYRMEILSRRGKTEELQRYYEALTYKTELINIEYSQYVDDYQKIYDILSSKKIDKMTDIVLFSFAMLKLGKYKEACDLLKPYYDNPSIKTGEIAINYLLAKEKHFSTNNKDKLEQIVKNESSYSDTVICCAYAMLKKAKDAIRILRIILKKEPSFRYEAVRWPALEGIQNDENFIRLVYNRNGEK